MKVSYRWLSDYVDLTGYTGKELAEKNSPAAELKSMWWKAAIKAWRRSWSAMLNPVKSIPMPIS